MPLSARAMRVDGIRPRWVPKSWWKQAPRAQGVGGDAEVVGLVLVPVEIVGIAGVIEFIV